MSTFLQVPKALERAGITKEEVEVFELNEAFASQVSRFTPVEELVLQAALGV